MKQSKSYRVIVTATDEMDSCTVKSSLFTVDNTPPTPGVVGVGEDLTDKVRTVVCYVGVLQTAHARDNGGVVYFRVVESTAGSTSTHCVGYFTSPGINTI